MVKISYQYQFKVPFMLYADFESILKPVDERYRDRMNTMKAGWKGKAPYTEKINTHVPSGWCVHSTFAYGDVSDPLTLFRMGFFRAAHRWGGPKRPPSLKPVTHPTMMKLGTIIPHPKKIQKIYASRDTSLEFYWHQHFFSGNQQILLYQEIQI